MRPLNAPGRIGVRGSMAYGTGTQTQFAPVNTVAPALDDITPEVDEVITCDGGTWTGTPTPILTHQWYRETTAIVGQTSATHTVVNADSGHVLKDIVTGTNAVGVTTADSNVSGVAGLPENTVLPVISDTTPTEAQSISTTTGTWLGFPAPTFTYQWQHGTTDIGGATSSSYTVSASYIGETLRVKVTGTNSAGAATATSASTSVVVANLQAETSALIAAMTMPPTGARLTAYDVYIKALIDNNLWNDFGALFIFCSETEVDSYINVISPADLNSYAEAGAAVVPTPGFAWQTNVGLKLSGQTAIFGYVRTKWAQDAMPGFNRDTVCYGDMQNGSSQSQNTFAWGDDSGNAATFLSFGHTGGVTRGNVSQGAGGLGFQSSSIVDGSFNCNAMKRSGSSFTIYSIDGGAFQQIGATAKGSDTTREGEKRSWGAFSGAADTQRIPIAFAFKTVTDAQIALMNSLSKTFLNAISVAGW